MMITLAGEFKPGFSILRISTRGLGRDVKFLFFSNLKIFQQGCMQLSTEINVVQYKARNVFIGIQKLQFCFITWAVTNENIKNVVIINRSVNKVRLVKIICLLIGLLKLLTIFATEI